MIDLHVHTNHSDGTDTVKELLQKAEKKGLEMISITDHDSVDAYYEIEKNPSLLNNFSGKLLVGAELKGIYQKNNIEVLAYGIDYHKLAITTKDKEKIQNEILQHFIEVGKKLNLKLDDKMKIEKENPAKQFASSTFAEEIVKYKENEHILASIGEKITRNNFYRIHESNARSPFYFDTSKYYKEIDEIVEEIHKAGGLAFLAHGFIYPFEEKEKKIEEILATTSLDGAECIYSTFTKEQTLFMKQLCHKYHKLMSGGSDYHALNKPDISIGTGIENNLRIDKELIENWIEQYPLRIL